MVPKFFIHVRLLLFHAFLSMYWVGVERLLSIFAGLLLCRYHLLFLVEVLLFRSVVMCCVASEFDAIWGAHGNTRKKW